MSKYFHNSTKLLIISGALAGALVFSSTFSSLALAEGTEVTEATATTVTTATNDAAEATVTAETTVSTESSATTEAATAAETTTTTETTTSAEAAANTTSTDDNGATIVRFYDPEVGWNTRINLVVGAYGTQYNGNAYIPATISDDHKSFTFDGNIQRDGYTLVGYSSELLSNDQRDNATADQSMPYTVDANGFVHVNFADITTWSVTDDLRDDTTTYYYFFAPLWAPNPEPEPEPEPEPQPEPEPTPVVPASDATQTPAPRREKSVLPNTGDASSVAGVVAAAGTTLVALGLRKKMK
ncbi:LPXTG cell wall anchor domain-containing protein [Lancefieldella parvula]|uniref:LPXTG cell wall anchor domain-containing protein n=1 Tax=Lancefieldella parvula TaxID=1382 RepID=UPI0028D2FEB8|nr:LPXTG cell wall anchor domain-containing protein [Lancefieldella parvula]